MISVMALLARNYMRQATLSRNTARGGEINLQCTIFQVIFAKHFPTDIIKCLQEMLVQPCSDGTNS